MLATLKRFLFGDPLNPLHPGARRHIALIALLAWIGLGADALSSSCYGPEEAYVALGPNTYLALYVAMITVVTIFIISIGYNQVIELFPSGGGGYKIASKLLHPYLGMFSGVALIVDYVLTISVSVASGTDAIFSFLPIWLGPYKLAIESIVIIFLMSINLRGMKEAIQFLVPIFLGFIVVHVGLIVYGILAHSKGLLTVGPYSFQKTTELAQSIGWITVVGFVLHAYSLGSGTYTGIEAISNNVQRFAEPRVRTGKRAMIYMAISLSFTAGGLLLLYLLWNAAPVPGQTLNAVVFHSILGDSWTGHSFLVFTLELEAALLLIAANAGFAGGPAVLAYMALDGWVPNRFRHLSSRLVVQNGLLLLGLAALALLIWTQGRVAVLVVLYSVTVFITFTLSLLGVLVYWIKHRASQHWLWHALLAGIACLVTFSILCITVYYKFLSGAWVTLLITSGLAVGCLLIKSHYEYVAKRLAELDELLRQPLTNEHATPLTINPKQPTAIIYINTLSVGMHTLLSILRMFPGQFRNFIFLSVGTVDVESFNAEQDLEKMQHKVTDQLAYFVKFCSDNGYPAEGYSAFGTDAVHELKDLSLRVAEKYPNAIFFSSQLIFTHDNIFTRFLHNQTPLILQQYLHFAGKELMIIPMKI